MVSLADYKSDDVPAWCPGCGNFSILVSLKNALLELGKKPHEILLVSGIGQAAKLPHYLRCNTFNGLHGRAIPAAIAAKITNHDLTIIVVGGDGDGYAEGGNHFVHVMRRNPDITYLVHDNQVYALTKGQTSPTSDTGFVTRTTPYGNITLPENPLLIAIACNCSLVARGFAGDIEHLTSLIKEGITHRGFSLIDILQPCVTFNRVNTSSWYQKRVYKVNEEGDYDPSDRLMAFKRAQEWGDRIPVGIIYKTERPVYEEQIPALSKGCLVKQKVDPLTFQSLLQDFK
jgi:2-oxoglutarate ferredoxin oxidoreductase subunit beta